MCQCVIFRICSRRLGTGWFSFGMPFNMVFVYNKVHYISLGGLLFSHLTLRTCSSTSYWLGEHMILYCEVSTKINLYIREFGCNSRYFSPIVIPPATKIIITICHSEKKNDTIVSIFFKQRNRIIFLLRDKFATTLTPSLRTFITRRLPTLRSAKPLLRNIRFHAKFPFSQTHLVLLL